MVGMNFRTNLQYGLATAKTWRQMASYFVNHDVLKSNCAEVAESISTVYSIRAGIKDPKGAAHPFHSKSLRFAEAAVAQYRELAEFNEERARQFKLRSALDMDSCQRWDMEHEDAILRFSDIEPYNPFLLETGRTWVDAAEYRLGAANCLRRMGENAALSGTERPKRLEAALVEYEKAETAYENADNIFTRNLGVDPDHPIVIPPFITGNGDGIITAEQIKQKLGALSEFVRNFRHALKQIPMPAQ